MALQKSQIQVMGGVAAAVAVVGGLVVFMTGDDSPVVGTSPTPLVAPEVVDASVRSTAGDGSSGSSAPSANGVIDTVTLALPEAGGQDVSLGSGQDAPVIASQGDRVIASTDPAAGITLKTAPADKPSVGNAATPAKSKDRPRFDVIRVDRTCAAVVAGKARPGQIVEIQINGTTIVEVMADEKGGFVALFDMPDSDNPQVVTLTARNADSDDRVTSSDRVFVMSQKPPAEDKVAAVDPSGTAPEKVTSDLAQASDNEPATQKPASEATATATGEATDGTGNAATGQTTASGTAAPGTDIAPTLPVDDAAPAVILANEDGVRIIQPPSLAGGAPDAITHVTLDVISYDEEGEVILAGRSATDRHVRVYVNNEPVKTGSVDAAGAWKLSLPEVNAGRYTLRVDEIDPSGAVTSRLETPFQKEKAEDVKRHAAELASADGSGAVPSIQKVTIQRGATLWALAVENYGKGNQYMQIFNANRDFIRDPDLIYPGQIFTIPE